MSSKNHNAYQYCVIGFALFVLICTGIFVYRELFPEYKIYQNAYTQLENFRSSYTHEKPAPFYKGVKQIFITHESDGKECTDRCVSCHVAMDLPHFSPVRIAHDVNNQMMRDAEGKPLMEANPDYVFKHLDERIQELRHPTIIEELQRQGKSKKIGRRLAQAEKLSDLKTVKVGEREILIERVIQMHPLIGSETRPFENHPLDKYGCTCCHNGNGNALVAKRAHGPVFDEEYEPAVMHAEPKFTEADSLNDPLFARMYNHKPNHDLIFQTTPLLAGPLVESKCVDCHQSTCGTMGSAIEKFTFTTQLKKKQIDVLLNANVMNQAALKTLETLRDQVEKQGREAAIEWLSEKLNAYTLTAEERSNLEGQLAYLKNHEEAELKIQEDIEKTQLLIAATEKTYREGEKALQPFDALHEPINFTTQNKDLIQKMQTDVDYRMAHFQRGKELFISQGCYACHRIAGFSRTNVGPELTKAGLSYPWYIKESIVWPQADLPTSTMPNFRLDHEELGCLMTFLMAQKGNPKAISEYDYQIQISEWEKGTKQMPWEKPIPPTEIQNVRAGQLVFASEGCASCHKLSGFESNYHVPSDSWFCRLFPKNIPGSLLAKTIEERGEEINQNILYDSQRNGILEEIDSKFPDLLMSFYTNFKWASRAYNTAYKNDEEKLSAYKERLHRVMMAYIQCYGLGRSIAPGLNWSGVWRDDEWLLGHFHNPVAFSSKSLMPVMPFDDTKFYLLQSMLHALGNKNRDKLKENWRTEGFNPPLAYQLLCSSCHGEQRQGNGVVAEWIFPIPKNLRNPVFLHHLTKERAIHSITHGVKGTPMPPWGETIAGGVDDPVLSSSEIKQLVDWLYQDIPQDLQTKEPEKWAYSPQDVINEMQKEKVFLRPSTDLENQELWTTYFEERPYPSSQGSSYYIRDKFYTGDNLARAQEFFALNCGVCHGKEGAGTGVRASLMVEAKPRDFTDIPWIRSEDDMFLLRSIKYGVPGTSMIPWGDQTTAAQRMELVLFIRHLSKSAVKQDELQNLIYKIYDQQRQIIEEARGQAYQVLNSLESQSHDAQKALLEESLSAEQAGKIYATVYSLQSACKKQKQIDALYQQILQSLKDEKQKYEEISELICTANPSSYLLESLAEHIRACPLNYSYANGRLQCGQSHSHVSVELIDLCNEEIKSKIGALLTEAFALRAHQQHTLEDLKFQ